MDEDGTSSCYFYKRRHFPLSLPPSLIPSNFILKILSFFLLFCLVSFGSRLVLFEEDRILFTERLTLESVFRLDTLP